MDYSTVSYKQVLEYLGVSVNGLNDLKVEKNRQLYGSNVLEKAKKTSLIARFFSQFKNLMIIILLISAVISLTMALVKYEYSDLFEGGIIFLIVIVNAIIGVVQEKKAENSLELLAKKTGTHTTVLRNGKLQKIETGQVVVGDIVELKAGDIVPADVRLITSKNLKCDESSLTGECQAVYKDANFVCKPHTALADTQNMCFSGTVVTFGKATGVVVSVGKDTQIGKIAKILNKAVKQKSPLEKNIDKIGKVLTIGILGIVAIVFIVELLFSAKLDVLEAFLIAIALAVAAIPESLPAVITIVMALGVERLAKKGAIVKVLGAVETLGCCNVICSDKTGTLTQNNMQVKHIFANGKLCSAQDFDISKNQELINAIVLCNNAQVGADGKVVGDATETSLINFCLSKNINIENINAKHPRLNEIPFDSKRKIMSTVNAFSSIAESGEVVIYSKGAFDYLIENCTTCLINGQQVSMTEQLKKEIERAHESLGSMAERVIAVTKKCEQKTQNDSTISEKNEQNLMFLGLFGIFDPPRTEVKRSISTCKKAGLVPVMITGDHPQTAFAVAKEVGIAQSFDQVITGKDLAKMSSKDLKKNISKFTVFCRVTPEDKVKIVKAFKSVNGVVAMTGDGVNDAPSLKVADIGIGMGSGTDVTKSVADLVLTDDDYSTIVIAVKEGRTIYGNIQKTLQFLISTNAVEVLGIFVTALVIKDAVFLLPSQILFINLITDSLPAFALGLEPPEADIMEQQPRKANETVFSGEVGTAIIYQAFVQTLIVLVMFVICNVKFGNKVASTMVFLTICLMQILHAVNCKTNKSLAKINVFANKTFNLSFLALFVLILLVGLVPFLQTAFNIVSLNAVQWVIVALSSISIIPFVELCKAVVHKYEKVHNEKTAKSLQNINKTAKKVNNI